MKTSLVVDCGSVNPADPLVRIGFLRALEAMVVLIEKVHIPNLYPHRFHEDRLLWSFFTRSDAYPLIHKFFEKARSCDRTAFLIRYHEGFWDMRINVKKKKATTALITMHFEAESGKLSAVSQHQ